MAEISYVHCLRRAPAHLRALITRKSCAVWMRNTILRNHLKNLSNCVHLINKLTGAPQELQNPKKREKNSTTNVVDQFSRLMMHGSLTQNEIKF